MKKFYKNSLLLLLALVICPVTASAQERDPFSPTSGSGVMTKMRELVTGDQNQQAANNFNAADPLVSTQLSGYKVIGVIVSDTQKVASIKAMNGVSYLVKVGDSFGSEGGKVSEITINGITVQTESQDIKLPVNNKIEVPVNAAKAQ